MVYSIIRLLLLLLYLLLRGASYPSLTPFECGFSGVGGVRLTFTLHFYKIFLIFVLFDCEVVLLIGFITRGSYIIFLRFIVAIYGSYYLEIYLGSLV